MLYNKGKFCTTNGLNYGIYRPELKNEGILKTQLRLIYIFFNL